MGKNFEFTQEEFQNILCTVFEGGISYWFNDPEEEEFKLDIERDGYEYVFAKFTGEDGKVIDITKEAFSSVINRLISGELKCNVNRKFVGRVIEERDGIDADDADVLFQLAVFGEVVYG